MEGSTGILVLVVDDEPAVRSVLCRILEKLGHNARAAIDGAEAARLIEAESFDVIISDVAMPNMNGIELLRMVRERDSEVPVVLISGAPTLDSALQAVEYGAVGYLPKPVDIDKLKEVVARAARLRAMARLKREALELMGQKGMLPGDRAGLEARFLSALDKLWVAYQPIVSVDTRQVVAHEALLRTEEGYFTGPRPFLDAAARLGQLRVLERAIRDKVAQLLKFERERELMFVNLHPSALEDPLLTGGNEQLADVAPRVVLEITERASMHNLRDVSTRVKMLRDLGYRIAIDDLGAGYAGLASFAALEPEFVKIDMALVRGLDKDEVKRRVIGSMVQLCQEMGMTVIAEGVETPAERDALVRLGCDLLQGFLIGRPGRPFPEATWG